MRRLLLLAAVVLPLAACGVDTTIAATGTCTSTDTWSTFGQAFMASNCNRCHANYSAHATVTAQSSAIYSQIASGRMPEGSALSTSDLQRVEAWLACGAP
jgi:hypothetical protein